MAEAKTPKYKPKRVSVNVPASMEKALEERYKELHYPSLSAYFVGLAVFDLHCKRPHTMTATLMREPDYIRDTIIAEIVKEFESKETKPGGWFEHRLKELIAARVAEEKAQKDNQP